MPSPPPPPASPPPRGRWDRLRPSPAWIFIFVASILFRLPPLINAPGTNSDAAIVGLQSMHILKGEWSWFLHKNAPVLGAIHRRSYSRAHLDRVATDAPHVQPGDFDLISLPTDFLGLNIHTANYVRAGRNGQPYEALPLPPNDQRIDSPWLNLVPQGMYWAARMKQDRYRLRKRSSIS